MSIFDHFSWKWLIYSVFVCKIKTPSYLCQQKLMEIAGLMNEIVERLQGRTAIVQIIVDGECHLRRVGDVNGLIDHPELVAPSATESFLKWMATQIEVAAVCEATKGNHRNCLDHLRRFRPTMTFADVNYSLVSEFDAYLRALRLAVNTIAKIMKVWHRYINIALGEDLLVRDPFRKYTIRREDTHKASLTERELKKLERGADTLPDDERSVVSAFLFSCYTGLRYSDLCRVRGSDVRSSGRQRWLSLRTRKTGAEVRVPLSVSFGGKAVTLVSGEGRLFDLPNNARSNILLRRAMKRLHIRKRVSMHCGRVTCATICLLRGVPLSVIQHMLTGCLRCGNTCHF